VLGQDTKGSAEHQGLTVEGVGPFFVSFVSFVVRFFGMAGAMKAPDRPELSSRKAAQRLIRDLLRRRPEIPDNGCAVSGMTN
jgi:hypothetical protein